MTSVEGPVRPKTKRIPKTHELFGQELIVHNVSTFRGEPAAPGQATADTLADRSPIIKVVLVPSVMLLIVTRLFGKKTPFPWSSWVLVTFDESSQPAEAMY